MWLFVPLLMFSLDLLCDPQILEDFLVVSELVQTASFSPVEPKHIIKVMVSCRCCLRERVKLLSTVLRAVRTVSHHSSQCRAATQTFILDALIVSDSYFKLRAA